MIGPHEVFIWAESLYPEYLRSILQGKNFFETPPRKDRLGRVPASASRSEFAAAVTPLWSGSKGVVGLGYTVIYERNMRRSRMEQNEPVAVIFETEDDFLDFTKKRAEVQQFRENAATILEQFPRVLTILIERPTLVVEFDGSWVGILEVVTYLTKNPRPGCFVRALPVSVHTKFIEGCRPAVGALLSVLPESGFRNDEPTFEQQCGFRRDEQSVRGRVLCKNLQKELGLPVSDIELRLSAWAALPIPSDVRVIACENKANFLSLPDMPRVLAFWGQGGAASAFFQQFHWLQHVRFLYWGDMDPSGFSILSSLRDKTPNTQSIFMDRRTLDSNRSAIGDAKPSPRSGIPPHLTSEELAAFTELNTPPKCIEQEKLLFHECLSALAEALK